MYTNYFTKISRKSFKNTDEYDFFLVLKYEIYSNTKN